MTQRKHEIPTPLPSPHAELAQEILGGVPLLLPAETIHAAIEDDRTGAGEVALGYISQMVQHHTGIDLSKQRTPHGLTQTDINELATLPDATLLARELRIANNFGNNMPNIVLPAMADKPTTKRSILQATLLDQVAAHYQSLPEGLIYMPDDPLVKRFWDPYLAIGKTGVGKTAVEALACFLAGVSPDKDKTIKAALATSTQRLTEEFAGRLGTSTFHEFLGKKVPVSIFYQYEQDTSGHVVVGCLPSAKEFVTGNEDFVVVDEGHNILGEKFMSWLVSLRNRRPLIATATPAYDTEKPTSPNQLPRDLRRICRSSDTKSIAELMEDEILNPTRVVEFAFDDDPVPLACELAIGLLRRGHRVGVYCEPGKGQPEMIAQLINKELGKRVVDWIASARIGSRDVEVEIISGTLQGFTTCKKLGEGSNIPELTGAVFINPGSALALEQHAGRFWRPSKRITELYHLIKRGRRNGPRLPKIIGVENADPDRIIGLPPDDLPENRTGPAAYNHKDVLPLRDLPALFLDRLILPQKEALISGERRTPSEGYTRLASIAATHDMPALWLQSVFDTAGLRHEIVLTEQEDSTIDYERWYAPELDDWLREYSLQMIAEATKMSGLELARIGSTTEEHINEILAHLGIESDVTQPANKRSFRLKHDFDVIRGVLHQVETLEVADRTDIPIGEAYKEFGGDLVALAIAAPAVPCSIKHVRRHPAHGMKGITAHLSQESINVIRAAHARLQAIPLAVPHVDRPLAIVARHTGINVKTLRKRLTVEEAAAIQVMRKNDRSLPGEYVISGEADTITKRLRPKPLPTSLVPPRFYKKYFGEANSARAIAWLREQGQELIPFSMIGSLRETLCMTWKQLQTADAEFGRAKLVQTIDFNQIDGVSVRNPQNAPDKEKAMAYRRSVLRRYVEDNALLAKPAYDAIDPPSPVVIKELEEFDVVRLLFAETAVAEAVPVPTPEPELEPEPKPVPEPKSEPAPNPTPKVEKEIPAVPPAIPVVPIPFTAEPAAAPEAIPQATIPAIIFAEPRYEPPDTPPKPEAKPAPEPAQAPAPEPQPKPKSEPVPELTPAPEPVKPETSPPEAKNQPEAPQTTAADLAARQQPARTAAEEKTAAPEPIRPVAPLEVDPRVARRRRAPEAREAATQTSAAGAPAKPATPRGTIPAHFVDAHRTLGPICSGPALSMLLRREKVQARIEQEGSKRIYWIDPDDAELLKLTIESMPIAPPDYKTAAAIAELYRKQIPHLAPHHIQNLVGRLVSDATPYMSLRRERLPDGQPGKFDFHYNDILSDRIEGAIEEAIRRGRISSLIRNSLR